MQTSWLSDEVRHVVLSDNTLKEGDVKVNLHQNNVMGNST